MADSVESAQELFREALDALSDQRRQIAEDLEFTDPADPQQWDDNVKRRRESDPGGARPCLVFDQIGQYIGNVAGQIEQRPPGLHAIPVDSGADRKVAEQLDGWFRHIEHSSRAPNHYVRAATSAARAGVGYLIVRPEYVDRALNWQEPRISSEGDPLRVVFDPWSVELDGSDANFGFLLTPFSKREFARRWEGKDAVSFGDPEEKRSSDDRESIVVAEGWRIDEVKANCIIVRDETGDEMSLSEDDYWRALKNGQKLEVRGTYADKRRRVTWRRMSGAEVLDESEYPADGIGIVPVYGYVGFSNGRMTYCGMGRRARSAQQAYNFHKSEERAYMLNAARAPWIGPAQAFAPYQKLWDRANVEARAYLPYEHLDESGNPIPAPSKLSPAIDLRNHAIGAADALRDIQSSLGMYQANLGAPSNESSGVAINERKQQGEATNAHFPGNLAAAVARVGKLCLDMVPRLVDKRRQLRLMSIDGTPGSVTVDPGLPQAMAETPQGIAINPNIGKYDVRVTVGASFSTQRTATQTALTEAMRANPQMAPAIMPLWAQTLDMPNADKLAQVLTAVAPPEVRAILSPEEQSGGPDKAALMAQLQQLQQALQEATAIAQEAQAEADEAKRALDAAEEEAEARVAELSLKAYDAQTKRLQVVGAQAADIEAIAAQTVARMLAQPDPIPPEAMPDEGEPEGYEMQPFPAEMEQPEAM